MVIFFTHSSSMIMLIMSVDRAIAISVVLRRNQIMNSTNKSNANKSHSNMNMIVFGIFALITLLNFHFLLFTHLIEAVPGPDPSELSANISSAFRPTHLEDTVDSFNDNKADEFYYINLNHQFNLLTNGSQYIPPEIKVYCYGYHDTLYYRYLTVYFPWYEPT